MSSSRLTTALVAAGSAVVAAVGVAAFAEANNTTTTAEVCVGPDGQVRVAEECRPSEEQLTIQGEQGPPGVPGEKGDPGPQGEQGEPGLPGGVSGYEIVQVEQDIEPGRATTVRAVCPDGKLPTGGGFFGGDQIAASQPSNVVDGWAVVAFNSLLAPTRLLVYAVCVDAQPSS